MKALFTFLAMVLIFGMGKAAGDQPNIVLILSDDQAWSDYGFMGHPDIETPHLDRLARRSLVFDRGYVASPLCRPSLATLVTGLFPLQHGVTGNDVDGRNNRAILDGRIQEEFHQFPSIVKMLSKKGYLTFQSGKWWEGSWRDGGFTHGMTHGDPERGGRHGDEGLKIGRQGLRPITQFIDEAVEQEKPFFVWYAPFLPHTPHNPPKRLLDKYTAEGRAADVSRYFAMCEWFDETCGELLGYLEQKNIDRKTLVFYLSDNGWAAPSTNANDPHQKTWRDFALRSKCSPFEKGIRTPIMISWPDQVRPGRSKDFAHSTDFLPTIASAAGITLPRRKNFPGIDLLDGDARRQRQQVFGVTHATHNMTVGDPIDTLQYQWCVEGEWKLIVRYHGVDTTRYRKLHRWDSEPVRLYRIQDDPDELRELSAQHPEQVRRMKKQIEEWVANLPGVNRPAAESEGAFNSSGPSKRGRVADQGSTTSERKRP